MEIRGPNNVMRLTSGIVLYICTVDIYYVVLCAFDFYAFRFRKSRSGDDIGKYYSMQLYEIEYYYYYFGQCPL